MSCNSTRHKNNGIKDDSAGLVVLVGNPNTGKSCLFNQLTGMGALVSNYAGTTVDILEGKSKINGKLVRVVDLPGVYALGSSSDDEKVTTDYVNTQNPSVIVNVVDAKLLERNLFLTLQLLELKKPMVVALNFYEELEDKGISIDCNKLSKLLGVPVVPIDALRGAGIPALAKSIDSVRQGKIKPRRTKELWHSNNATIKSRGKSSKLDPATALAQKRHSQAAKIAQKVLLQTVPKKNFGDYLDRFTTEPISGTIVMILLMGVLLFGLLSLGSYLSTLLGKLFELFVTTPLTPWINSLHNTLLETIINWSLQGINAGIQIALPYVFLFYLALGILEDSGYLPRMAYLLDRIMHKFGLHGQAILPMMLGFGCSVPAVMSTRTLQNKRDRLMTSILICLIPCSARNIIILGAVSKFLGVGYALLLYAIILFFILITGYILGRLLPGESTGLIMELSEYRIPSLKNVLKKTWMRVNDFIIMAFPLIIIGSAFLGILKLYGTLDYIILLLTPIITGWLMLPAVAGITLIFGLLRKELALELLFVLGGSSMLLSFMTPLQIFIFALVVALYVPCIGTIAALKHEFSWKTSLLISISTIILAIVVGGLVSRIFLAFGILS